MAKKIVKKSASKKAAPKKAAPALAKQAPPIMPTTPKSHQLTMDEKKEYAEKLYLRGDIDQQDIARIVGVSANTMSKWVNDPDLKWKAKRRSITVTKQEILRRLYSVVDKLSQRLDDDENSGDTKEADKLIKYTAAINQLETETNAAEAIEVFMKWNKYLLTVDPAFVAQATAYQDMFIKELLKRY